MEQVTNTETTKPVMTKDGQVVKTEAKIQYKSRLPEDKKCINEMDARSPANQLCAMAQQPSFLDVYGTFLIIALIGVALFALGGMLYKRGKDTIKAANNELADLSPEMRAQVQAAVTHEKNDEPKASKVFKLRKQKKQAYVDRTLPMALDTDM